MIRNETCNLGWCIVHFEITDMVSQEVFVWVEGVRPPTRQNLIRVREILAPAGMFDEYFYCNVDTTNETHMRFARFFGFREVRRQGNISVQVWERDKCKLLC
jgi:hypothetical protein